MDKIILASSSPRRQALLAQIGITFKTCIPNIDESIYHTENITNYALRMAKEKAQVGYAMVSPNSLVIAADTCGEIDGVLLGKPINLDNAKQILQLLSNKKHQIHTSYALYNGQEMISGVVTSSVIMRTISEAEIEAYWMTGEPCDKAGAYAIQGIGAQFISHLTGSYSAVMGLPLYEVAQALTTFGINRLGK